VELIGVGSDDAAEADGDEMSLHELIVAQIRREVHHRRLIRGKVRGPLTTAPARAPVTEADGHESTAAQESTPAAGNEGADTDDLVPEGDEVRRT
jgi:hypothetical protein